MVCTVQVRIKRTTQTHSICYDMSGSIWARKILKTVNYSIFDRKSYDLNYYDAPSLARIFICEQKLRELKQEPTSVMQDT